MQSFSLLVKLAGTDSVFAQVLCIWLFRISNTLTGGDSESGLAKHHPGDEESNHKGLGYRDW